MPANIWKDVLLYIAAYYIIYFSLRWVSTTYFHTLLISLSSVMGSAMRRMVHGAITEESLKTLSTTSKRTSPF